MAVTKVVMLVGVIIQVTAIDGHMAPLQFCFGRVITGIGNGANTATVSSVFSVYGNQLEPILRADPDLAGRGVQITQPRSSGLH